MSQTENSNLLDEATEYINSGDLSSTPLEKMLHNDLLQGDMTALWQHVLAARNFLREDESNDAY